MPLIGKNTILYGHVEFGKNVVLEDNVVIGHPSAAESRTFLSQGQNLGAYRSVEELYHAMQPKPVKIGDNATIRSGSIIYSGVTIGEHFDCSHNVLIREDCTIGNFVYLKAGTIIYTRVTIGNHCRLAGSIADCSTIGDHVSSFGTLTHRYAHHAEPGTGLPLGPTLHQGCIIGRGAVVIDDIHVYEDVVIGANTVVNFDVPAGSFVVGSKGQIRERKANTR